MIRLTDFSTGFHSAKPLVTCAEGSIPRGSLCALVGRNGSGKSTLLRCLGGENRHYTGTIEIAGHPLPLSPPKMARMVATVTTARFRIPHLTVREAVASGRAPYTSWTGRLAEADRRAVDEAMSHTHTHPLAHRLTDTLSDGEFQRVMIARAIAQETPVMLLDEPTSFLDVPGRRDVVNLLRYLTAQIGVTVLFSTHEVDLALSSCTHAAVIDGGKLQVFNAGDPALTAKTDEMFR